MNFADDRYAVVRYPDRAPLARWLRPVEAAAFAETYNRLLTGAAQHVQIEREPLVAPPPEVAHEADSGEPS